MRFLSIAALSGLLVATVYAHAIENHDSHAANLKIRATNCPGGSGVSGGGCQICPAGTYGAGGNKACQSCPGGSSSVPNSSTCTCQPGYYSNDGSATNKACSPCASGSGSPAGSRSCQVCPANTYANGDCTACPSGTSSQPGSSQCYTTCNAGQYWSGSQCNTCPAGFYSSSGANSCSTCPADTYSSAGASSCTSCPAGQGSNPGSGSANQCTNKCNPGQIYANGRCKSCDAGSYQNGNECTDCPPGTIARAGSTSCSPCDPGSVPTPSGQTCRSCPAKTYANGDDCTPCPAGTTSSPGSTSCSPEPSKRSLPPREVLSCAPGFQACRAMSGNGAHECINPMTTLDACGGCAPPEGEEGPEYTGRDCSSISNVNEVGCNWGRCEIKSCRSGYEPSGDSCVPKSGPNDQHGSLRTRGIHTLFARFNGH